MIDKSANLHAGFSFRKCIIAILILITALGCAFRFYHITQNQFIYYDEGMWLNHQRGFVTFIEKNPPKNLNDLSKILEISMHISLKTGKALWSFFAMIRGLFVGTEGWYFTRVISAVSGSLTLIVLYLFASRFTNSRITAILSMALLAILPSHFYYSRTGLQEGFSTLCFLLGMYYYFFPKKLTLRVLLSGIFFSFVFFSNYRMIVIPFLLVFCEIFYSFSQREYPQYKKFIYTMLTFLAIVILIGSIDDGANTKITFGWMFHQVNLADGSFDPVNLLSYPYYLFHLETFLFGAFFFGNVYFLFKKEWSRLLPFVLSLVVMLMFSFSQEKGVRYACAVMPFMAMAVAMLVVNLFEKSKNVTFKTFLVAITSLMIVMQVAKGYEILHFSSDYETSMADLNNEDKNLKIMSTQSNIQKLFSSDNDNVMEPPLDFKYLLAYYFKGYQYLIIDPQAYISFTDDGQRFTPRLKGYLGFIEQNVPYKKIFPHFNQALLERFALEHNINLKKTVDFIRNNKSGKYGALRVYDLTQCIIAIRHALTLNNQPSVEGMVKQ